MTQRQQCTEDLRNNLKDLNMLFARAHLYKYDRMAMTTIEDYIIEKLTQACVNADKLQFLFPDECKEGDIKAEEHPKLGFIVLGPFEKPFEAFGDNIICFTKEED